jgi:SAM-dependent methyltransferase
MTSDHAMYADKSQSYFGVARKEIAPLLPDRTDRVLEIGAGSGATMKWLRDERTVQYSVGIEIMDDAAARAATIFDEVLVGDVETVELPSDKFDLILALDVLEHLVDPWLVVRRLHSFMKPGGVLIASIPNVGHYSASVRLFLLGKWNYAGEGLLDRTHLRFFTRQSAIDLLTCSGLVEDKVECARIFPPWDPMKLLNWILPRHLLDYQYLIRVNA